MMRTTLNLVLLSFLTMAVIVFIFLGKNLPDFSSKVEEIQKYFGVYSDQNFQQKIWAPKALVSEEKNPQSFLTEKGVIEQTNNSRRENGLPVLKENSKLSASALAKAKDMFENQYFEHDSPEGIGVGDLAKNASYQFLAVGENLALGDFDDDQILVSGWMDSPGHRANILNKNFNEIGVAVLKGEFEGRMTWIAVQHFGIPLSYCPIISATLKGKIEENKNKIVAMESEIDFLRQELEGIRKKDRASYAQRAEEYNDLVSEYNSLILGTKTLTEQYNHQVKLFNECAASIN